MKFLSLLKNNTDVRSFSSSWAWPSCHQPKTLSFRATTNTNNDDVVLKTINSAFIEETPESFFTESPNSASFSTASEESRDPIETVIRGLSSDRFFFEPDETSSIFEAKLASGTFYLPFKNSVALSMDSKNPYLDFRKSMEEMVETHGVKDWESLEELLCWYLKINGKNNHAYIVGAFVDLLVPLAFANSASLTSYTSSSPSSFSSSSLSSSSCTRCANPPSSSFLLPKLEDQITPQDEASSSSLNA
ncbi:hypothetical protein VNO77_15866 [Canavalia gladiata]|uniref:Transcription repressor n=1 Tax=Canavalia gladiata TaxID=3824 RepID=A0AAN9M4G0_CANGL